jgi:FtsP/CotA-like multicopper oxidase with cupredoxin domain
LASLWRSLPGIGIAAVAVFAAFAVATGGGAPGPVYAGSDDDSMAGMDMGAMQGAGYWQDVSGGGFHSDGVTRTYYISADKVVWDYAPQGTNEITGKPFDDVADTYVKSGPGRIGSRYVKCLYRGYTDATFGHRIKRPADEKYLGLLGPVIRAEVGDTIKVVFRNTCPFPASVHPHGVFYAKNSEGAPYNDGTHGANKADDAVPTSGTHTYVWDVPPRAGPGPDDGSSVMWMYHSHTDEVSDTYAGLMGPMEITRRGMARPDGSPKDVDREVFALFSVMNENSSPFLDENVHRFAQPPFPDPDDEDFEESNLMHSINGYVFGNQPMIAMHRGEHVRWYVMSMGTEVDLHTPHWHGNTVTVNGMRMDVVSLLPATMVVADMVPDDVGTWLFHCHVNDHIRAGMLTRYTVLA